MASCPSYGNQQVASYSTHLPWLAACFMHTTGLVVEFGSGDYSTNMLHALCAATGRPLITVETDKQFVKRFLGDLDGADMHNFMQPSEYVGADIEPFVGLAFIDCEPPEQRGLLLEQYRKRTQIIVCHNTESPAYNYDFSKFKYRKDCDRIFPMTTAASMKVPLDFLSLPGNVRDGGLTFDGEVVVWSQR